MYLLFGSAAFWAVVSLPALRLAGPEAFRYTLVAWGLCLAPTLAAWFWYERARRRSPGEQLLVLLGGTGARMAVVLGAGLALYLGWPYFRQLSFWVWLLVFYLYMLGLELSLLLLERRSEQRG
jgi:hypothetical protein